MKLNVRSMVYINGVVVCCLAGVMFIPLVYDFFVTSGRCFRIFAPAILASVFLGGLMILSCRTNEKLILPRNDLFFLVVTTWLCAAIVCAFPFYVYPGVKLKFISALFEAVSGITTTGATAYKNVEILPRALNLWRFILHFIGGVGIVAIGIMVLPIMRIGGMQLFQTENSDKSQKFFPRATQAIKFFIGLYILLIGLFALSFKFAGMSLFDSVCHGISAISTGGFSTHNTGIEYFKSSPIKLIMSIGMFIGGLTFLEIVKVVKGEMGAFFSNQQTSGYLKLTGTAIFVPIIIATITDGTNVSFEGMVAHIYTTISAITTTGLNFSDGYMPSNVILFILAVIGSCSGSTTGGIKIFRIQILFTILWQHINKLVAPYNVSVPKYQCKRVDPDLTNSVISFIVTLIFVFILSCVLLEIFERIDLTEALHLVISGLFNLGYGANFGNLSNGAKLILMFDMLAGRLEILPIFILLRQVLVTTK